MSSALLPPNATPQERAMGETAARVSDVPVPLRTLWNAATCPADLLPWIAWGLSVDDWDANWTEAQKRAIIADSVEIHRKKGTIGAVKRALAPFGLSSAIQEWWEESPTATPHTFRLFLAFNTTPVEVQDSIINAVRRVKPVRSEMIVEVVQGFLAEVNAIGLVRPATFFRVDSLSPA